MGNFPALNPDELQETGLALKKRGIFAWVS